jgi:hypothetical protein
VASANAYVEEYLTTHNARFAVAAASSVDHHRPRDRRRWADADVFCLESSRTIGNDYVVQYQGRVLQLDRRAQSRIPVKSQVLVREARDGSLRVVFVDRTGRERRLAWTPATPRAPKPSVVIPEPSSSASAEPRPAVGRSIPAPDHPWRAQHRRWKQQALARKADHASAVGASVDSSATVRSAFGPTDAIR